MTKEQLEQWAERHGFQKDKWGYYQKSADGKEYRLKLSSIAVRYEVKIHHDGDKYSPPSNEWVRLQSGYFKDLTITPDDKLAGLKR